MDPERSIVYPTYIKKNVFNLDDDYFGLIGR